jgi:hypothetical protein
MDYERSGTPTWVSGCTDTKPYGSAVHSLLQLRIGRLL